MGRSPKGATPLCKTCGETNVNKFQRGRLSRCKKCHSDYAVKKYHERQKANGIPSRRFYKKLPRLCTKCGETDPAKFREDRCSLCKKCCSDKILAQYYAKRGALQLPVKRRGRRPKIEYDPADVERAARFGLTVKEYLDAMKEV